MVLPFVWQIPGSCNQTGLTLVYAQGIRTRCKAQSQRRIYQTSLHFLIHHLNVPFDWRYFQWQLAAGIWAVACSRLPPLHFTQSESGSCSSTELHQSHQMCFCSCSCCVHYFESRNFFLLCWREGWRLENTACTRGMQRPD